MNIAVIGASGFIGKNLIKQLLEKTNHKIVAISPAIDKVFFDTKYEDRIIKIKASTLDKNEIEKALVGTDVAYYLVHMMANDKNNFFEKEKLSAEITGNALRLNNIKRVIYMSGLGNDRERLSEHLLSRHQTGDILRKYVDEVIELRASMIIGEGSISFEIVRNIVEKSPLIILPKWAKTKTQPIGINDALSYLENSLNLQINNHQIIEIGGQEVMSYKEFIKKYAKFRNKKNIIIRIPFLSEKVAGFFLNIFTSREQTMVGQCMLGSFRNEMIITDKKASILYPHIHPKKIEDYFI